MPKVVNSLHRAYRERVLASQNLSFFDPFFIYFSTFVSEPLPEGIFGAPSASKNSGLLKNTEQYRENTDSLRIYWAKRYFWQKNHNFFMRHVEYPG